MKNILFLEVFHENDIKKGCSRHPKVLKTSYIYVSYHIKSTPFHDILEPQEASIYISISLITIMISTSQNIDIITIDFIYQPIFIINSSAPKTSQIAT